MRNKKSLIKLFIILALILGIAIYAFQTIVLADDSGENNPESAIEGIDNEQLNKVTASLQQMLGKIPWSSSSPINSATFNSNPNYFCAQHGTAYATTANIDGFTGSHDYLSASGLSYVKYNGGWDIKTPAIGTTVRTDHKQDGENLGTRTSYSNFHYEEIPQSYSGGIAFVLARYKQTFAQRASTGYTNDPLQHAIWYHYGQLGAGESNPLKEAMDAYDAYYDAAINRPNIDVTPDQNVGTVKSGNNYVVGPFVMSKYVRAVDYKFDEPTGYSGGQSAGNEDETNPNAPEWSTGNTNLQNKFGTSADMQGTIIKAVAILNNGTRYEFPVPDPGATFNITIPISVVGSADELEKIEFTYQRIHATGNGTKYEGYQVEITWVENRDWNAGETYYCGGDNPHSHSGCGCDYWSCPGDHFSGYDSEGNPEYNGSCSGCEPHCKGNHTDCHGHSTGEPISGGYSTSASKAYCSAHGHTKCRAVEWKVASVNKDHCQDGLEAYGSLWSDTKIYTIDVNVPLTTDLSIYKYIVKVNHTNNEYIFGSAGAEDTSRKFKTNKSTDTVKVERGDTVTYRIDIENKSRFDVRVKVKDYLPSNVEQVKMPSEIRTSSWITVAAHSTKTFYITLVPNATTGSYTNTIQFITRNDTNPHMEYTYYKGNGPGPIGNLKTR